MMPKATKVLNAEFLTELPTTVEVNELDTAAQYLQLHLATPLSGDWAQLISANTSQRIVAVLRAVIMAEPPAVGDREVLTRRLRQLQQELRELPVLKLKLAVSPSPVGGERLSRLTRALFGAETVLAVEIDPRLLGGAVLVVDGRYFDHSLRRRLEERWPAIREELAKELAAPAAVGEVGGERLEART